ncbi:acyl carrier protein [Streptomyces sp. NPDC023838]|uniref:acyl carrier protein n=1 Tax=Streptomyces sp. NPDC023838 TaxID=3154325 RepID=UPI003405F5A5
MNDFTLDHLKRFMRECSGGEDPAGPDADVLGENFTELGFDSLALLQMASLIEREFGVALPDEGLHKLDTPQKLIDLVNEQLGAHA